MCILTFRYLSITSSSSFVRIELISSFAGKVFKLDKSQLSDSMFVKIGFLRWNSSKLNSIYEINDHVTVMYVSLCIRLNMLYHHLIYKKALTTHSHTNIAKNCNLLLCTLNCHVIISDLYVSIKRSDESLL